MSNSMPTNSLTDEMDQFSEGHSYQNSCKERTGNLNRFIVIKEFDQYLIVSPNRKH